MARIAEFSTIWGVRLSTLIKTHKNCCLVGPVAARVSVWFLVTRPMPWKKAHSFGFEFLFRTATTSISDLTDGRELTYTIMVDQQLRSGEEFAHNRLEAEKQAEALRQVEEEKRLERFKRAALKRAQQACVQDLRKKALNICATQKVWGASSPRLQGSSLRARAHRGGFWQKGHGDHWPLRLSLNDLWGDSGKQQGDHPAYQC